MLVVIRFGSVQTEIDPTDYTETVDASNNNNNVVETNEGPVDDDNNKNEVDVGTKDEDNIANAVRAPRRSNFHLFRESTTSLIVFRL